VREWLKEILPPNAAESCRGRVNILVRPVFSSALCVNDFSSNDDLIDACLASAHVPLFMDRHLTASFRDGRYIDDDWMGRGKKQPELMLPHHAPSIRMSVGRDARVRELASTPGGTLKLMSREKLIEVMDWGSSSVHALDPILDLQPLEPLRRM